MQLQPASLTQDLLNEAEDLILGEGSGPGLVLVRRSLLLQICTRADRTLISPSCGHLGLLLGPEPQSDDLLIEDAIPLESEADLASVQPRLEEARQKWSHTAVGWYRILSNNEDSFSESGLEFPSAGGQELSPSLSVRCCFIFICSSASETLLRVYMRNAERWQQIQEVTLHPQRDLTPEHLAKLSATQRPLAEEHTSPTAKNGHLRGRLWLELTIVTLLLLSIAMNTLMVRVLRSVQREKVDLAAAINQVRESTVAVSQLPLVAAAPVLLEYTPNNRQPVKEDLPRKQVLDPPPAPKLIARTPAMLKPSEAFQFQVTGNPAPKVVWSSQGPGSIDPVYGLYRAPSQFAGETKVRVIAKSWRGSQTVTFTLRGASK